MPDQNGSTPKRDFRQEVTDNIIRMLEQGTAPWQKPWKRASSKCRTTKLRTSRTEAATRSTSCPSRQ
jgi:antirestriction protein ArdC